MKNNEQVAFPANFDTGPDPVFCLTVLCRAGNDVPGFSSLKAGRHVAAGDGTARYCEVGKETDWITGAKV